MRHTTRVLESHPRADRATLDALTRALRELQDCTSACEACASACLSERDPKSLERCIRLNQDCATVCSATLAVLSRGAPADADAIRRQLSACEAMCRACAEACERHARMAHCQACAEACRQCERACADLARGMLAGV